MVGYLNLLLRLTIWFLLTADVSLPKIIIGMAIAFQDWLRVLGEILVAIPQAYIEAVEIMVRPHHQEDVVMERVKPQRTPGLVFNGLSFFKQMASIMTNNPINYRVI